MKPELGTNVFDYGHKAAADQMRTTMEKIVQYVGANLGPDIANELENKTESVLAEPAHTAAVLARHANREALVRANRANLQAAREARCTAIQAVIAGDPTNTEAPMELAILQNEIAEAAFQDAQDVEVDLTKDERSEYEGRWKSHNVRKAKLEAHRGQAYSLMIGQCTQLLQDKMKQDPDWQAISASYEPLRLYRLIEKLTLSQTEDQYPFETVYEQEVLFYSFRQGDKMSNSQWYERFNTKIDVSTAIGVTRKHKVLLEYVSQDLHNQAYDTLTDAEKTAVEEDAEERYVSYVFLRHSRPQHGKLRNDLKDDFTTGDNRYPKTRQQQIHLLDRYTQ